MKLFIYESAKALPKEWIKIVSIIIPVYNEEAVIKEALGGINRLEGSFEVIIVDGGSGDKTLQVINDEDIKHAAIGLVRSPRGRAKQMNYGASLAENDTLLFLHADSILPPNAVALVESALKDEGCIGGGFSLAIDEQAIIYRLIALFSNLRVRLFGHFFGDQAVFMRKEVFWRLGGFREIELMEDMDLSQRAKKIGKMIQLPDKVKSSARRWKWGGVWRTIWLMQKIKLMYFMGVEPGRLKKMYGDVR